MFHHWLVVEPPTPLKNDGVKVSWDDEIPIYGKNKIIVIAESMVCVHRGQPSCFGRSKAAEARLTWKMMLIVFQTTNQIMFDDR
jgi:hypothetical protein